MALDTGVITVVLDVHEGSPRLDPRDKFVESVGGVCARGDDEVVTWYFDVALKISDFRDVNGYELRGLGLIDVRDLLAETKFDVHLYAFAVQEFDKFVC